MLREGWCVEGGGYGERDGVLRERWWGMVRGMVC